MDVARSLRWAELVDIESSYHATANAITPATSIDICEVPVRNCDTPVIKDEIALPCPITLFTDKRPTRSTSIKPIGSGTASRPPGIRLAEQGWRQTEVNPVALALYPLSNP